MPMMLAVAAGGALGSLARYGFANTLYVFWGRGFPYGTLGVNLLGCFTAGLVYVLLIERLAAGPEWRGLLLIGFLGGFTTFSAFSVETLQLWEESGAGFALLNVALNVVLSVGGCALGLWLGRQIG